MSATKDPREGLSLPQSGAFVQGKFFEFIVQNEAEHIGPNAATTDPMGQVIAIKKGMYLHQLKDTVLHELIHAIDYGTGLGLKERQVHVLAATVLELLWSNPSLSYWLVNRDAAVRPASTIKKAKRKATTKKSSGPKKKVKMGFMSDATSQDQKAPDPALLSTT
jgi:hypothetical protein